MSPTDPIVVRATEPHEYEAASFAKAVALLQTPAVGEQFKPIAATYAITTSLSAWDGADCVGHAGQFFVDTVVPGGRRLPTGAVTRVGVLPTHRRRGVAKRLMHGLIDDAVDRELPLMSLRASQATIYGRFGFGVAGDFAFATIDPKAAGPLTGADTSGSFRMVPADQILSVIPPLYDRVAMRRPGRISRPLAFDEQMIYADAIKLASPSSVVVHLDASGEPDGFVHYSVKTSDDFAHNTGTVHDVFGANDAVELALWQFIVDVDLVHEWHADERPTDDLVRWACRDLRAYRIARGVEDEQWLRLVDVDRCLTERTYGPANGSVVIEVVDTIDANNRRWRVAADGARVTDDDADLVAPIAALSAAYLGGRSWKTLAITAGVACRNDSALEMADSLFNVSPLPHCGTFF